MAPVVPEGYRVKFQHFRMFEFAPPMMATKSIAPTITSEPTLMAKGGVTIANIHKINDDDTTGEVVASGSAECSEKENYNGKLGRQISVGRALKALNGNG